MIVEFDGDLPFSAPARPFVVLSLIGVDEGTGEPFYMVDLFPEHDTEDGYVNIGGGSDLAECITLAEREKAAGAALVDTDQRQHHEGARGC